MPKPSQRMQYFILGAIVAGGLLYLAITFFVMPRLAERRDNLNQLAALQTKLDKARSLIRTRSLLEQQQHEAQERIFELADHIPLPVLGNYLLGMEEQINQAAHGLDVRILQVANQDIQELEGGRCQVYRVRVSAQAGFNPLLELLRNLQTQNPMCSVMELNITPNANDCERHDVVFNAAWLIWVDPAERVAWLANHQP